MNIPTEFKSKTLTKLEVIELLTLLPTHNSQEIAKHFAITEQAVSYYRGKYNISIPANPLYVNRIIAQLQKDDTEFEADYEKQEKCVPKKFYFKCHSCGITLGERDCEKMIEHINRHIEPKKLVNIQL